MALVDVLLPIYNAARTIEASLESVCTQTMRDLRVLAVDDGSTDGTADLLARMAARDPRIVVLTRPNGGVVDALNTALAHATAPFVARQDADDLSYPERFAKQLAFLEAHADVVAIGCNTHQVDEHGKPLGTTTGFRADVHGDPFYAPSIEPYLPHPFLFARRQALLDAGGYRYSFHSEDTDLYWRLTAFGRLSNVVDVLGEYRLHPDSISSRSIVNGRIAAVCSQRAAVSEQRRRRGVADLAFPRELLARYESAVELDAIIELASDGMTDAERRYLAVASAAKLVELEAYRPYRLTHADRRTMRRAIRDHYGTLTAFNQRQLVFRLLLAAPAVARAPLERLSLLPWALLPSALVNAAGQRVRRWAGRAA